MGLMKQRPETLKEMKEDFEKRGVDIAAVLHLPSHLADDFKIRMEQGGLGEMLINLPPRHKLLLMLKFLEQDWSEYADQDEIGFDPKSPLDFPTRPQDQVYYRLPLFYDHINRLELGTLDMDFVTLFWNRVGDYCFAGCRR